MQSSDIHSHNFHDAGLQDVSNVNVLIALKVNNSFVINTGVFVCMCNVKHKNCQTHPIITIENY